MLTNNNQQTRKLEWALAFAVDFAPENPRTTFPFQPAGG
jgi:hypothetical protein